MDMNRRAFIHRLSQVGMGTAAAGVPFAGGAHRQSSPTPLSNFQPVSGNVLERASASIEQIRKRDVTITFLDRWGQPLTDQSVQVEQLRHQFLFGDNNWTMSNMFRTGLIPSDRADYYRKRFKDVFNSLNTTVYWTERPRTFGTKTMDFQGDLRLESFEESVNWANANGLTAKGHPLFWSIPKAVPEWAKKYDHETFMKFVEVRVRNLTARYDGKGDIWDAVNEALWEPAPKNLHQRTWPYAESMANLEDYITKIIRWGREESPGAKFVINDYGIGVVNKSGLLDQNGKAVTTQRQRVRYLELIERLCDAGYPPNVLGLQSHTGWLNPEEQMELYDQMAAAGLPISITEFWAHTKSLLPGGQEVQSLTSEEWRTLGETDSRTALTEAEAEALRDQYVLDYLTVAFGHPAVQSFYFWGFMGMAAKFQPTPSSGHTLKPLYEKVRKRIHEDWKTQTEATTDEKGQVQFRGFCGTYLGNLLPTRAGGTKVGHHFTVDEAETETRLVIKTVF
jgi:GH35 family endo-1,4-beta-xylanase